MALIPAATRARAARVPVLDLVWLPVSVAIPTSREDLEAFVEVEEIVGNPELDGAAGYCWSCPSTTDRRLLVLLFVDTDGRDPGDLVETAIHEAAHAAAFALDHVGEKPTHEIHAYLTAWVAARVIKALPVQIS